MAEISAQAVKELREKTGAGMMDCKKALKESDGDMTEAAEWLRKKGITSAGKKESRVAAEGLVESYIQDGGKIGVLLEVNCETDFVARRDEFQTLVRTVAAQAVDYETVELLMAQPAAQDSAITVEEFVKQTSAQLGEKIQVRRFVRYVLGDDKAGRVGSYIHTGGRVGVLVEVDCETATIAQHEEFPSLVRNLAMQVAACREVEYVQVSDIPPEIVQSEKAIEMGRDDLGNKPDNIKEKIVQGRIDKRLKELTLLDQAYIRDQSVTVEELLKQMVTQLGGTVQIRRFTRFIVGEGIEKQESNFAQEVAEQIGG